jgi:hypothetical protein
MFKKYLRTQCSAGVAENLKKSKRFLTNYLSIMKLQELNHEEAKEINGGLLGLFGNNDSQSSGSLIGKLGIHFSNHSVDEDGSSESTNFGTNLDLGGIFNSLNS